MNLENNQSQDKVSDLYGKINNAEQAYQNRVSNQKVVKNVAFLALGVAGIGVTSIATMLLGKGFTNMLPLLVSSIGIGGVSSVMALTTASFMKDAIVYAETEVKNAYSAITVEQKGELLTNRKNLCSSIADLRERHLQLSNLNENKLTQ